MGRPTAAAPPDSEEELDAEGLEVRGRYLAVLLQKYT